MPVPQILEQIVDVPVPQIMEETVEVVQLIPQERVQQRTLEETVNVPVLQIQQPIVAVVKAVLSWGGMTAPPGGHSPKLPRPATRSVDLVAAGLGSGNTLSRHTSVSAFIS